jgi:hypothetical protein
VKRVLIIAALGFRLIFRDADDRERLFLGVWAGGCRHVRQKSTGHGRRSHAEMTGAQAKFGPSAATCDTA